MPNHEGFNIFMRFNRFSHTNRGVVAGYNAFLAALEFSMCMNLRTSHLLNFFTSV